MAARPVSPSQIQPGRGDPTRRLLAALPSRLWMEHTMHSDELIERNPMRAVAASIGGGLQAGQVGGVLARAGVGKSAFLIHVALHALLRDARVLHVSLSDPQDHVRSFYDEIFNAIARKVGSRERATLAVAIERHRVIHSCLGRSFGPDDLRAVMTTLADVMSFRPDVVVVDEFEGDSAHVEDWTAVAAETGSRLWLSVRTHRDGGPAPTELAAAFTTAVALAPSGTDVALRVLRQDGTDLEDGPALHLDPVTMLLRPEDVADPYTSPPLRSAATCTMVTGGADGAEARFGENAEQWGVTEVTLALPGRTTHRDRGLRELSEQELAQGDVSFLYVNRRLNRHWTDASIKSALQLQWHLVSKAQQLFVVGVIQDDDTVHGGTGWSVELAKRWHKAVWVYDQEREGWFTWLGNHWTPGLPLIETPMFAGTGTLHLNNAGGAAIDDLFARSFGARG